MKACFDLIERKYYKKTIRSFEQPVLTWNGILGGDTFAVSTNNFPWSNHSKCYQWFDGTTSGQQGNGTAHTGGGYVIFYNPNPLKLYSTYGYKGYSGDWFDVYYYGSDDGENWTLIKSFSNGLRTTNVVDSQTFYKYHKVYNKTGFSHDGNGYGGGLSELIITANEEVYLDIGTPDDYDYYEDVYAVRALVKSSQIHGFI